MELKNDKRIVMTLDAGGTNFVFSAIQANEEIIEPVRFPSNADNLDLCLKTIVDGFQEVKNKLKEEPSAISFAFPGPADYPAGIIGDLANLPAFRGGFALGPMLQDTFNIPVYLNNDGDFSDAISYEVRVSAGRFSVDTATDTPTSGEFPSNGLSGTVGVKVTARDKAGNQSAQSP
jgi:hypothetical protein